MTGDMHTAPRSLFALAAARLGRPQTELSSNRQTPSSHSKSEMFWMCKHFIQI